MSKSLLSTFFKEITCIIVYTLVWFPIAAYTKAPTSIINKKDNAMWIVYNLLNMHQNNFIWILTIGIYSWKLSILNDDALVIQKHGFYFVQLPLGVLVYLKTSGSEDKWHDINDGGLYVMQVIIKKNQYVLDDIGRKSSDTLALRISLETIQ
jgi:hypothetical protein